MVSDQDFVTLQGIVSKQGQELHRYQTLLDQMMVNGLSDLLTGHGFQRFGGNVGRTTDKGLDFLAVDSGDVYASVPNAARIRWLKDAFDGRAIGEIAGGYATPTTFENNTVAVRAFSDGWDSASTKEGVYDIANDDWLSLWQTQIAAGTSAPQVLFGKVIGGTQTIFMSITESGDDAIMYLLKDGVLTQVIAGGGGSMPMPPIVSTMSWHCIGTELAANATTAAASATWPVANTAVYIPLLVTEDITVKKLWWHNGATASGNVNMALYTAAFALVPGTETGSTAQTGANIIQEVDIADTALTAGLYYMALVKDDTTGTMLRYALAFFARAWGIASEASVFDLPATATPADPVESVGSAYVPVCGIATRTQVA